MKKYIIRNFLRRVKFDYFFRFLNLTLHSKIFFKRSHFLKFGKIVHFNNLNFLVKPFVLNRFSLLFFRSNFIVQGRNYNFILKDLNNSDANFLFSDYGFFSHNNIKKLFSIKGSHFFFFNCLYRYETILKKLDDFAISQYLCETLSGRIFKLLERKFIEIKKPGSTPIILHLKWTLKNY